MVLRQCGAAEARRTSRQPSGLTLQLVLLVQLLLLVALLAPQTGPPAAAAAAAAASSPFSFSVCTNCTCGVGSAICSDLRALPLPADLAAIRTGQLAYLRIERSDLGGVLGPRAFAGLPSLETLIIGFCGLHTVDVNAFADMRPSTPPSANTTGSSANLKHLFLRFQSVRTLPRGVFRPLSRLIELNLRALGLVRIEPGVFDGLDGLELLSVSRDSIAPQLLTVAGGAAVFRGLPALRTLRISGQALLGELDFRDLRQRLPRLTYVEADVVTWTLVPPTLNALRSLQRLRVQGVLTLTKLTASSFRGMDRLQSLELTLSCAVSVIEPGVWEDLSALTNLEWDGCGPASSVCRLEAPAADANSRPNVSCTCVSPLVGDGTFCDQGCPETVAVDGVGEPMACTTGRWLGAECIVRLPSGDNITHVCVRSGSSGAPPAWVARKPACGHQCTCTVDTLEVDFYDLVSPPSKKVMKVKCQLSGMRVLPAGVPSSTAQLVITAEAGLMSLQASDFAGFADSLIHLDMTSSGTSLVIVPGALRALRALKKVRIEYLTGTALWPSLLWPAARSLIEVSLEGQPLALGTVFANDFPAARFPTLRVLLLSETAVDVVEDGAFTGLPLYALRLRMLPASTQRAAVLSVPRTLAPLNATLGYLHLSGRFLADRAYYAYGAGGGDLSAAVPNVKVLHLAFITQSVLPWSIMRLPLNVLTVTAAGLDHFDRFTFPAGLQRLRLVLLTPRYIARDTFTHLPATGLETLDMVMATVCSLKTGTEPPRVVVCDCLPGFGGGEQGFCDFDCGSVLPTGEAACLGSTLHGDMCVVEEEAGGAGNSSRVYVCNEGQWERVARACGPEGICMCEATQTTCQAGKLLGDHHGTLPIDFDGPGERSVAQLFLLSLPLSSGRLRRGAFDHVQDTLSLLSLDDCGLTSIEPGALAGLSQLSVLILNGNNIAAFPSDLFAGGMHAIMRVISVGRNVASDFPLESVLAMPALVDLDVRLNLFGELMESMGPLPPGSGLATTMTALRASSMGLTRVPVWVRELRQLRRLNVELNHITGVWRGDFGTHPAMQVLDMSFNTGLRVIESGAFTGVAEAAEIQIQVSAMACNRNAETLLDGRAFCVCAAHEGSYAVGSGNSSGCLANCSATEPCVWEGEDGLLGPGALCAAQCSGQLTTFECGPDFRWMRLDGAGGGAECLQDLSTDAPSTTAPGTGDGGAGAGGSSSDGGGGGGGLLAVAVAVAVVAAAAVAIVAVFLMRRRRSARVEREAILGELTRLMEVPMAASAELYEAKFGGLGPVAANTTRVEQLELGLATQLEVDERAPPLGEGHYGVVRVGVLRSAGAKPMEAWGVRTAEEAGMAAMGSGAGATRVAVKTAKVVGHGAGGGGLGPATVALLLEARVMCMLEHPHVVRVLGVQTRAVPPALVLEFCAGGDLRSALRRAARGAGEATGDEGWGVEADSVELDDTVADMLPMLNNAGVRIMLATQIAEAMVYLHARLLLHNDLAARNVMLAVERKVDARAPVFVAKVGDLGLARAVDSEQDYYRKVSENALPVKWVDPVALAQRRFTSKSDVWSFGVVLWELFSGGQTPYRDIVPATNVILRVERGYRLPPPAACPSAVYALMQACWHKRMEERPGFQRLEQLLRGLQPQHQHQHTPIGGDGDGGGEPIRLLAISSERVNRRGDQGEEDGEEGEGEDEEETRV